MKITGFDWDAGNWPKCGKHGVSREEIEQLFREGKARIAPDVKHSTQDEGRYIAVGRVNNRQMFVVFSIRDDFIRPISARYMHAREVNRYEKSTNVQN